MEILNVRNIYKRYSNHHALQDVTINIPRQSIFGLLGPNGAGKTTLIRIITQIIAADAGEILIRGEKLNPSHIRTIGYLPEERGLYKKMKVGEQLMYLTRLKGLTKADSLERIKIWLNKFDILEWWGKNVEELSKGMQQKVQFIATVLHQPDLIILDEPFSGFDPINANLIKDEILELRNQGSTIIFSTHRMESVEELCDHIALIDQSKKILDGPTRQIKEAFKDNTYLITHKGDLQSTSGHFELIEKLSVENDYFQSTIKINQNLGPNDLLKELTDQVEIHGFKEKIPSINDIFISAVNEKKHG
ncbi:MAG: ATP-binding cassette domain-containing protein [Bacteroidetes bacterium]|nr:ATP-binding cassette domain-containing protein [Bacteroidota bacterium]